MPRAPTDPGVRDYRTRLFKNTDSLMDVAAWPHPSPAGREILARSAIHSIRVEMFAKLCVSFIFLSPGSVFLAAPFLDRVLLSRVPLFHRSYRRLGLPATFPPRFVSFAWQYLVCVLIFVFPCGLPTS